MVEIRKHTIDAAGKTVGRVASQAAKMLMGKSSPSYTRNIQSAVEVSITNAGKLRITERKRLGKIYSTYSGHPGGMKRESLSSLLARKGPEEVLRRAITRMLPRNATRVVRLKRLQVTR